MEIVKIIIGVILAAAIIFVLINVMYYRNSIKKGQHNVTVGTIEYWQDAKIPFFGRVCVRYKKRGAPHHAMSCLIWKRRKPKVGSSNMWDIVSMRIGDKTVIQARRAK